MTGVSGRTSADVLALINLPSVTGVLAQRYNGKVQSIIIFGLSRGKARSGCLHSFQGWRWAVLHGTPSLVLRVVDA